MLLKGNPPHYYVWSWFHCRSFCYINLDTLGFLNLFHCRVIVLVSEPGDSVLSYTFAMNTTNANQNVVS